MRLALFQPDIPQNAGTLLRTAMCLGLNVDIIEPCGFVMSDKRLKRAGLDYLTCVDVTRHETWEVFQGQAKRQGFRVVLLPTKARTPYTDFIFKEDDILMVGRESAGVPDEVFEAVDERVRISMVVNARSLNVAVAAAMVIGEGLRQQKIHIA